MKKAVKAAIVTVAFIAGTIMLGTPESNVITFDWFGRFAIAGLVVYAAIRLLALMNNEGTTDKKPKNETV